MSKLAGNSRAALLGVLFAMVGFSYAIASMTTDAPVSGHNAGARAAGSTPLHFTNPIVSGERDLGDIVAGSGFVRWVRAAGGVEPYKFTSTVAPTLKTVLPLSDLLLNGQLVGSTAVGFTIAGNIAKFKVTVVDSGNTNGTGPQTVTETFRLQLVTGSTFRFAVDAFPAATQFRSYISKIETLNGHGPFKFSIVTGSISLNGSAVNSLDSVGLDLSEPDGTLYGKPFVSGSVTFTVRATDATSTAALGRFPSTTANQTFTVDIEANTVTSSSIIANKITIKGDTASPGKDSISYAGYVNLGDNTVSSLAGGKLVLHVGDYVTPNTAATPAVLDAKGKTIKPTVKDKTAPTLKGSVGNGQVKITVGKESFASKLGTISGSAILISISVQVGDVVSNSEFLRFDVKTSGPKFQLTYSLGKNIPVAGGFLVTSVSGKDDTKAAQAFDSWKVGFLSLPVAKSAGNSGNLTAGNFGGTQSAIICIGGFADKIGASESKGKVKSTEKRDAKDANVTKLAMDGVKGKGSLQTGFLPGTAAALAANPNPATATGFTGTPTAGSAGDGNKALFALNITLKNAANGGGTEVYSGEAGATMFAKKTSWTSKNPVK